MNFATVKNLKFSYSEKVNKIEQSQIESYPFDSKPVIQFCSIWQDLYLARLISQKYTGDSAAIKVLRNSETVKYNIKLSTHRRLIPAHNKGQPPSYYIIAGFVFTTVSVPYLRSEVLKRFLLLLVIANDLFFIWKEQFSSLLLLLS